MTRDEDFAGKGFHSAKSSERLASHRQRETTTYLICDFEDPTNELCNVTYHTTVDDIGWYLVEAGYAPSPFYPSVDATDYSSKCKQVILWYGRVSKLTNC